jgi:hypothetical protein
MKVSFILILIVLSEIYPITLAAHTLKVTNQSNYHNSIIKTDGLHPKLLELYETVLPLILKR